MSKSDPMDVTAVLEGCNRTLSLQYRSALELTLLAGSLTGPSWHPFSQLLWSYAEAELDDARRLVEKVVALGGEPSAEPASFSVEPDPQQAVATLIDHECEAVAALHAIIPATGQEPRSEALEHRLEHVIMRKQEQIDTLRRATGRSDGS
jgi:bacterioferritin (cytochrome b1)